MRGAHVAMSLRALQIVPSHNRSAAIKGGWVAPPRGFELTWGATRGRLQQVPSILGLISPNCAPPVSARLAAGWLSQAPRPITVWGSSNFVTAHSACAL